MISTIAPSHKNGSPPVATALDIFSLYISRNCELNICLSESKRGSATVYMLVVMLASSRLSYPSCSLFTHRLPLRRSPIPKFRVRSSPFVAKFDGNLHSEFPLVERMQQLWSGRQTGNSSLVEYLHQNGVIKSSKVADVMLKIDRGLFVPGGVSAYVDSPMSIGYNATISAPHMHATCLELLKEHLQPGMHALDIGSGTGYLTACFAMMVGPQGRAVGVEHIPELVAMSIENVKRSEAASLLADGSLSLHGGDGRLGWPDAAPYNAIHVGAAAPEVPKPLIEQLKLGGRMVIPVGSFFQDLQVIDKQLDGSLKIHTETSVRYVPLTAREEQIRGF